MNDLILCILCILHNAKFDLFDGTNGLSFLSVEKNYKSEEMSVIALYVETGNFSFPIISSDLGIMDYMKDYKEIISSNNIDEYASAIRNEDGTLELNRYSV